MTKSKRTSRPHPSEPSPPNPSSISYEEAIRLASSSGLDLNNPFSFTSTAGNVPLTHPSEVRNRHRKGNASGSTLVQELDRLKREGALGEGVGVEEIDLGAMRSAGSQARRDKKGKGTRNGNGNGSAVVEELDEDDDDDLDLDDQPQAYDDLDLDSEDERLLDGDDDDQAYEYDSPSHSTDAPRPRKIRAKGSNLIIEEPQDVWDEVFVMVMYVIPLGGMWLMFDILAHQSYNKNLSIKDYAGRAMSSIPTIAIIIFFSNRYISHPITTLLLAVTCVISSCRMFWLLEKANWLVLMQQFAPTVTLSILSVIQLPFGRLMICFMVVGGWCYWKGLRPSLNLWKDN